VEIFSSGNHTENKYEIERNFIAAKKCWRFSIAHGKPQKFSLDHFHKTNLMENSGSKANNCVFALGHEKIL
jgi:hypothetical protein